MVARARGPPPPPPGRFLPHTQEWVWVRPCADCALQPPLPHLRPLRSNKGGTYVHFVFSSEHTYAGVCAHLLTDSPALTHMQVPYAVAKARRARPPVFNDNSHAREDLEFVFSSPEFLSLTGTHARTHTHTRTHTYTHTHSHSHSHSHAYTTPTLALPHTYRYPIPWQKQDGPDRPPVFYDNSHAREDLELVFSSPQKAVVDAAVAFLDLGMVQPIAHAAAQN